MFFRSNPDIIILITDVIIIHDFFSVISFVTYIIIKAHYREGGIAQQGVASEMGGQH